MSKSKGLPKELTTVTGISRAVALLMFISLPIIGFLYGRNYQTDLDSASSYQLQSYTNSTFNIKESNNWKVLRGSDFIIKYPDTLNYQTSDWTNSSVIFSDTKQNQIIVKVFNKNSMSEDMVSHIYFAKLNDNWKNITIGKYKAKETKAIGSNGLVAILPLDDKIYYFQLSASTPLARPIENTFFQMLSTFKLTQ